MTKPVLVIMAAGIGSRYGGLKQMDPVGPNRELIIDYSIYDALKTGFDKIIVIINEEILNDFKQVIGDRISRFTEVEYAFQRLIDLPEGHKLPKGRVKPWGTAHAVMSAGNLIKGPFAVINADDFYGREAFKKIYGFLDSRSDNSTQQYAMVGYKLINTITEHGYVARGICDVDDKGMLKNIMERTRIEKHGNQAAFTEDGQTWMNLPGNTIVSMNLWGFTPAFLEECRLRFSTFLKANVKSNPLKCEYFLPSVVNELIAEGKAAVKILTSGDKWYGVTYKQDKPSVVQAIEGLIRKGLYNRDLWGGLI